MILGIIQVRYGSARLPGKVMKEVAGQPLLWHLFQRVKHSSLIDKVVIATVNDAVNSPIIKFAKDNDIDYFAGSEKDLTDRIYQTAKKFGATVLVRITGDCPLADPQVIDKVIEFYLDNRDEYDYVSNAIKPTFPDGLDVAVFPVTTIERAWNEIKDPFWKEWVSSYIIEHPDEYRIGHFQNDKDFSHLRWTVDYEEDLDFVRQVFEKLYPGKNNFLMGDILDLLQQEPSLIEINKKHKRNEAYPPTESHVQEGTDE